MLFLRASHLRSSICNAGGAGPEARSRSPCSSSRSATRGRSSSRSLRSPVDLGVYVLEGPRLDAHLRTLRDVAAPGGNESTKIYLRDFGIRYGRGSASGLLGSVPFRPVRALVRRLSNLHAVCRSQRHRIVDRKHHLPSATSFALRFPLRSPRAGSLIRSRS